MLARSRQADLAELIHHCESGRLQVPIDKTSCLEQAAETQEMLEREPICGNIVLTIAEESKERP